MSPPSKSGPNFDRAPAVGKPEEKSNRGPSRGDQLFTTHRLGANAAGAASGTLLAAIAQNLPEQNHLRVWLLLLTPTVSLTLSSAWSWMKDTIENHIHQKEKEQLVRRLHETIQRSLEDPNLSRDYRDYLRKQLVELKRLEVSGLYQRIKFLEKE